MFTAWTGNSLELYHCCCWGRQHFTYSVNGWVPAWCASSEVFCRLPAINPSKSGLGWKVAEVWQPVFVSFENSVV